MLSTVLQIFKFWSMSGYRSLHREQVVSTAIWSVKATELLTSSSAAFAAAFHRNSSSTSGSSAEAVSSSPSAGLPWRIWTATADGCVRSFVVEEKSVDSKVDTLDASALKITCSHLLVGLITEAHYLPSTAATDDSSLQSPTVLGFTNVCCARNYVGDDDRAGMMLAVSINLAGQMRLWELPENMDDPYLATLNSSDIPSSPELVLARAEFEVENATGTTAELCPPRVSGVSDVVVAVGCLNGSVSIVATGRVTPKSTSEPYPAGQVLDRWGIPGSAVPLSMAWHPSQHQTLAVGRQDGVVDILTGQRKNQRRLTQHTSPVRALAFTPDGQVLVAASDQGLICVWDMSRKAPVLVHHVMSAHKSWVLDLTTLPDSRRFVTAGADRQVHVWDVGALHQPVHSFQADTNIWTIDCGYKELCRFVAGNDKGWLNIYSLEA